MQSRYLRHFEFERRRRVHRINVVKNFCNLLCILYIILVFGRFLALVKFDVIGIPIRILIGITQIALPHAVDHGEGELLPITLAAILVIEVTLVQRGASAVR